MADARPAAPTGSTVTAPVLAGARRARWQRQLLACSFHEAGHCCVMVQEGLRFRRVWVGWGEDGQAQGGTHSSPKQQRKERRRPKSALRADLAGLLAELKWLQGNTPSSAWSAAAGDLAHARSLAMKLARSRHKGAGGNGDVVQVEVLRQFWRVLRSLDDPYLWRAIELVAHALIDRGGKLSGKDVRRLVRLALANEHVEHAQRRSQ